MYPRRKRGAASLIAGLALLLAAGRPAFAAEKAPAPQRKTPSNKQKAPAIPSAPVSELIRRIQTEEARLEMARSLARMAASPEEMRLAQKAVRLADHELDLAFLIALRRASEDPVPDTKEAHEAQARVDSLQTELSQQQALVDRLKKQVAAARGRRKDTLQSQLDYEAAKLELASDELNDAREDLINAGGDLKSQIERLKAEHEAAEQHSAAESAAAAAPAAGGKPQAAETALPNLQAWFQLRSFRNQLLAARDDALAAVDTVRARQAEFEKRAGASAAATRGSPETAAAAGAAPSILEAIQQQSRNAKILAGYKLRLRDLTELAKTYQQWSDQVAGRQWLAGRRVIEGTLWIVLILLVALIANRLVQRFLSRLTQDRRRLHTLHTLSRFAVQVLTLGLILLVVLGPPSQLATVLAFAGAGLTVALKDFIVSFIGWFMLMGPNGVHVGDWGEINGVSGEVVEVSLFHTVLLETGNWNDPGHPTGRKVTFTNSYAIEGHYFNFSTSGQWMWDELEVLIPPGESPIVVADAILRMVMAETQTSQQQAEQEWQKLAPATRGGGAVSAAPVMMVQPTFAGITARFRYITRASERFDLRVRLYHRAVEMLQGGRGAQLAGSPVRSGSSA